MLSQETELEDFVTDPQTGDPAIWRIVNLSEGTFDLYGALVLQGIHKGFDDMGNEGPVITLMVLRTTRDGRAYLKRQNVHPKSVFTRSEAIEALDGTTDKPRSMGDVIAAWRADRKEFLASLPTFGGTVLAPIEATEAAATQ